MADIAGIVDALGRGVHGGHELGEGLPAPVDAGQHGVAVDVFRALQIAEHEVGLGLAAGGEREAAIAHHRRGDAVIAGAGAELVPEQLRVHVRVAVHEAGRDDMALGIDDLFRRGGDAPDARDPSVLHADIGAVACEAGAVHDGAVPDDEIVAHGSAPSSPQPADACLVRP